MCSLTFWTTVQVHLQLSICGFQWRNTCCRILGKKIMSYLLTKNPTTAIFHKLVMLKRYRYTHVHLYIYICIYRQVHRHTSKLGSVQNWASLVRTSINAICKCQHLSSKITHLLFLCFVIQVIAIRATKGSHLWLQVAEGQSERKGKCEWKRNRLEGRQKQDKDKEKRGDEGRRGNRNIVLKARREERNANIRKARKSNIAILIKQRTETKRKASEEAEWDAQLSAFVVICMDSSLNSRGASTS